MNNYKTRCYAEELDSTSLHLYLYSKDTLHEICLCKTDNAFSMALVYVLCKAAFIGDCFSLKKKKCTCECS